MINVIIADKMVAMMMFLPQVFFRNKQTGPTEQRKPIVRAQRERILDTATRD